MFGHDINRSFLPGLSHMRVIAGFIPAIATIFPQPTEFLFRCKPLFLRFIPV
jgi:hypothetical protein